jgi:hypothetical protein
MEDFKLYSSIIAHGLINFQICLQPIENFTIERQICLDRTNIYIIFQDKLIHPCPPLHSIVCPDGYVVSPSCNWCARVAIRLLACLG